ncbi:CPBP family intramembrane glutamic endopeptidase [Arthrobacter sp. M4]|uniref:CPBP family intramembrane glutamic endopeptidase n=1 Tax=Arthrobacter sp. M4 TaxID=218160 RepID=UPI001CDD589A|nr:CPBP family intramembrane glutamic endopeptidase [Arthrobacter sp. M4]MCA4133126.1 CPBP family intramembrane metalloprotease [Arthrobacter sp. M4]
MRTIPPPGRLYDFSGLDTAAVVLYVGIVAFFSLAGTLLVPLLRPFFGDPASATFAVNLAFYTAVGVVALTASRTVVSRDLRILATRPWFTLMMVPLSVVAMLVLSVLFVTITGTPRSSENQLAVENLVQQIPPWLVIPLLVVVGPFVEEYIFRHLLIGKLSKRVNIWICCAASVFLFSFIHVVGREGIELPALAPYLGMGVVLVAVYVWTGKNVMFSYFVHASKNLLAAILIYAIPPDLINQLQQLSP